MRRAFFPLQCPLQMLLCLTSSLLLNCCNHAPVKTIGVSIQSEDNPFYRVMVDALETEAKKKSSSSNVFYHFTVVDAGTDSAKQQDQVEDFIKAGVNAIVLVPVNSQDIDPAILEANTANIPVFLTDIGKKNGEGDVAAFVTSNNRRGGLEAAKIICHNVRPTDKIVILSQPSITSVEHRILGFEQELRKCRHDPDAVDEVDAGSTKEAASSTLTSIFHERRQVAAVFGINDNMALGAVDAVRRAHVHNVQIVGYDAGDEAVHDVGRGYIAAEVVQYPACLGSITRQELNLYFATSPRVPLPARSIPIGVYIRNKPTPDPKANTVC